MSWIAIIEIGLKLWGFFRGFVHNKKENMKWMADAAEVLYKKGLVSSRFLVELEADRDAYLEAKLDEMMKNGIKTPKPEKNFKFSERSLRNLGEAHDELQRLFHEVIKHVDCVVIEGHRPEEEQNKAYKEGKSKLRYPNSKHNSVPSHAVDVCPYPIDWENIPRFYEFGELVVSKAKEMGISIRWGGDWDGDGDYKDQTFNDLVHFELN